MPFLYRLPHFSAPRHFYGSSQVVGMTPRLPWTPHRRRRSRTGTAASATVLVSLTLLALGVAPAHASPSLAPAAADAGTPIDPAQYSLVQADSESPPYPAPPALDGTALAAFDNDTSTQWTVAYDVVNGTGVAKTPMPHWLTLDVGGSFTLTGLDYSVKNQANGPVKDFRVFVTDSAAVARDPKADWGAPAASGSFHQPAGNSEVQTAVFGKPVTGRYVK